MQNPEQRPASQAVAEEAHRGVWGLRDVTKWFGRGTRALDSVDLEFPYGAVTGLLGENGAGKSTLLGVLNGSVTPTAGWVTKGVQPVRWRSPGEARQQGVAVVPQHPDVIESLSVAENILLTDLPHLGILERHAAAVERAEAAVESLGVQGLVGDVRHPAARLSAAGRQMVEILRAVVTRPSLLALDEPTTALDPGQVDALVALVQQLRNDGIAVIYVTHRLAELQRVATRVVVMRDGRVVGKHEGGLAGDTVNAALREMSGRTLASGFHRTARPGSTEADVVLIADRLHSRKLRDVSLELRRGEILGVAGLAGSGRTELARALAGDMGLRGGSLVVGGRQQRGSGRVDPARSGTIYISEDRQGEGILPERNIRENISAGSLSAVRRGFLISRRAEEELVQSYIDKLSIRCSSMAMPVTALSGGNQQKVVLARAMAMSPRVWVLDEPTKGVDVATKHAVYEILDGEARQGRAVVFISSEIPELLAICDRILVLRDGAVSALFSREDASEEKILAAMFGFTANTRVGDERRQGNNGVHP